MQKHCNIRNNNISILSNSLIFNLHITGQVNTTEYYVLRILLKHMRPFGDAELFLLHPRQHRFQRKQVEFHKFEQPLIS